MPKPTIKKEIQISRGNPLLITTSTADAYNFVKTHAPEYGKYYEPNEYLNYHRIFVCETYDINEVADYLEKMEG